MPWIRLEEGEFCGGFVAPSCPRRWRPPGLRPRGIIFLPSRSGRSLRGKAPGISNTRVIYPCEKAETLFLLALLVVAPPRLGAPLQLCSRHFLLVLGSLCPVLDRLRHIKKVVLRTPHASVSCPMSNSTGNGAANEPTPVTPASYTNL